MGEKILASNWHKLDRTKRSHGVSGPKGVPPTKEQMDAILEQLKDGSAGPALKATKVSLHAFMKYRKDNPDYDAAVKELDIRKKQNKRFR